MKYYEVTADDERFGDSWFLSEPFTNGVELDERLLNSDQVEAWHDIRNGIRVDVRLVPLPNLRYSLSIDGNGLCRIDAREFTEGRPYTGPVPSVVPIRKEGPPVAFHLGAFDMPVVTREVADILQQIAPDDIQRFPVIVGDGVAGYEIMNAVHQRDCVDEARSGVRKWKPEDGRPDKLGQYREIGHLVIDPSRTHGSHVFRIWGSLIELIVSQRVKDALSNIADLGIVFQPVS